MSTADPITRVHIPEHIIIGKRLGRHVVHDARSWDYRTEAAPAIIDVDHGFAKYSLPLDQGSLGSCTANALTGAANSDPNISGPLAWPYDSPGGEAFRKFPSVESDAVGLYSRETADEGSPYPPNDPGGSGLAVCRAARELGWIKRWANAFTLDEALRALVMRPVITGINWYTSFDSPDGDGLVSIAPGATVRGGHEVVATQIITSSSLVGFWNSWGTSFGVGGRFFMSFDTWEQLLSEQGDVTVPGAAVAR